MRGVRGCVRALGLACSLWGTACGVLGAQRTTVPVGVLSEKVLEASEHEELRKPPALAVRDLEVEGTRVAFTLSEAAQCVKHRKETVEITEQRRSAFVNSAGEEVSTGRTGGIKILLGLLSGGLLAFCGAAPENCGGEEADPSDGSAEDRTEPGFFVAGAVVGGVFTAAGLIDLAAAGSVGETSVETFQTTRRKVGAVHPCREKALPGVEGHLLANGARLPFTADEDGKVSVDLESLRPLDQNAELALRVQAGEEHAELLVSPPTVAKLVERLSPAGVPSLRSHVVAVLPVQYRLRTELSEQQQEGLLEVYGALLSREGLRLVPTGAVREALNRERRASYRACIDDACQIEVGRQLAASVVLRTVVTELEGTCTVSAVPFDLRTNTTLAAATKEGACGTGSIRDALMAVAVRLAQSS